jgi:hypothetical protein
LNLLFSLYPYKNLKVKKVYTEMKLGLLFCMAVKIFVTHWKASVGERGVENDIDVQ